MPGVGQRGIREDEGKRGRSDQQDPRRALFTERLLIRRAHRFPTNPPRSGGRGAAASVPRNAATTTVADIIACYCGTTRLVDGIADALGGGARAIITSAVTPIAIAIP